MSLDLLLDLGLPGIVFLALCIWLVRRVVRAALTERDLERDRLQGGLAEELRTARARAQAAQRPRPTPVEAATPRDPVPAADGRGANPARSMRALARSIPAIAASLAVVGLSRSVYVHFVAERPSDLLRPRQAFNEELRPLATLLPARGEVGYVTDEAIQSPGGEWQGPKQRFLQVQYAVAPVVLRYDEDRAPLVLVNATSEKSLNELVARRGLIVVARVTSGLAVARPK